jgi:hypothetical protein
MFCVVYPSYVPSGHLLPQGEKEQATENINYDPLPLCEKAFKGQLKGIMYNV